MNENENNDHQEFFKKEQELVTKVKTLKEKLSIENQDLEKKMQLLINETYKAYDVGYEELHTTIHGLEKTNLDLLHVLSTTVSQSSNVSRETIDEILQTSKDVHDHLKNPLIMTTNEVCGKTQLIFAKVFKILEDLKVLFEEKSKPFSSKRGKGHCSNL